MKRAKKLTYKGRGPKEGSAAEEGMESKSFEKKEDAGMKLPKGKKVAVRRKR